MVASAVGGNPEILPERCLVDPGRPQDVAAALVRQGLEPADRPRLEHWPDVAQMCALLAAAYDGSGPT